MYCGIMQETSIGDQSLNTGVPIILRSKPSQSKIKVLYSDKSFRFHLHEDSIQAKWPGDRLANTFIFLYSPAS